ncbi:MAG: hypothetical protein NT139_02410 [Candidatus Woesearchaeota archaeon]|nr:hypothetical protein [Candidatus Woesearchaeota archaeon]
MRWYFLKEKAVFMIFIIICSIFTIYLFGDLVKDVNATQQACCEKTKDGASCLYTDESNCASNYNKAYTTCDQTQYCKKVCCIDQEQGRCYKNTAFASCRSNSNTTSNPDASCETVSQCNKGCCILGNECSLTTKQECVYKAIPYPSLNNTNYFNEGISDEFQCLNECTKSDEGCCINYDGTCTYTTKEQCPTANEPTSSSLGFLKNQLCSSSNLECGCTPHHHKACVPDQEDVYWFDSCGNKEEVAEDCNYDQDTYCGIVNNETTCKSINCLDPFKDPRTPSSMSINSRKNGETWCMYESGTGDYLDRPGSRHYRDICVFGNELVEPCREYREEVCVEGRTNTTSGDFSGSSCLHNEIYDSLIKTEISTVQQGFRFWEEGEDICSAGNTKCTVTFNSCKGCVGNCQCLKQQFIDDTAKWCKAQGDCGANYNILGVKSSTGFIHKQNGVATGRQPSESAWQDWAKYGIYGGMQNLSEMFSEALEEANYEYKPSGFESFAQTYALPLAAATIAVGVMAGAFTAGTLYGATLPLLGFVGLPVIGWILAVVAIIFILISLFKKKCKIKYLTVTTECHPWQAPIGSADCNKCVDKNKLEKLGFNTCTEYLCKSLGSSCEIVNEGTTAVDCVDVSPNDVNAPIITPWREALTQGYSLNEKTNGYSITQDIAPYTAITFGIKTDELAQCKLNDNHTLNYNAMLPNYFTDPLYKKYHNITLLLPDGQSYNYYVRCQDRKGNYNLAEYTISFQTIKGPDITPPIIQGTSIANNAFIANNIKETPLLIYTNEPSDCRWDQQDKTYEQMYNLSICEYDYNSNALYSGSYECLTALTNIKPNQDNNYYFRCKDLVNNTNQQSYVLTLKGTSPLNLEVQTQPTPNGLGEIYTNNITLYAVTTNGAENGKATCSFSLPDAPGSIEFVNTNSNIHTQPLVLEKNNYLFDIRCYDSAGNNASQILNFQITADLKSSILRYVYSDATNLYIILDEESTCQYSLSSFTYGSGTDMSGTNTKEHSLPILGKKYYVNCKDIYNNAMPEIIVYVP